MAKRQYSTFYLGENLFAIDILLIREINRNIDITPVEQAPPYVKGLLNLRGQIVTVLDLGVRLGIDSREILNTSRCVVLRTNSELAQKQQDNLIQETTSSDLVGLLVDQIGDIVSADDSKIEPPPANVGGVDGRFLAGVIKLENKLVVTLEITKILALEE